MLTPDQIQALKSPFPDAALSNDTSRGFALTSIKAAYIIERLNDVFGPCGSGWRYVHSPFAMLDTKNGGTEIVTEVAFQYRLEDETHGCPPCRWSGLTHSWDVRTEGKPHWSEPILACGGKSVTKGGAAYTDARKSAVTDGLTKAVSLLGVGHQVFKGEVRAASEQRPAARPLQRPRKPAVPTSKPTAPQRKQPATPPKSAQPKPTQSTKHPAATTPTADATTFWALYNREARPVGVPREEAQTLVYNDNWGMACANLRVLIAKAQQHAAASSAN